MHNLGCYLFSAILLALLACAMVAVSERWML